MSQSIVTGIFLLIGVLIGAYLTRRTEYKKWLRKERSIVFSEFLRQLHGVRKKAIDIIHSHDISPQERDLQITEFFIDVDIQAAIVRMYLEPIMRDSFSGLAKELWLLHGSEIEQAVRIKGIERILLKIQNIFEQTIRS